MHGTGQIPRRDERLYQLAREHGLEESYLDITGQVQEASPEILRGVLTALGVPVEHEDDVEQALRAARAARWSRLLEPVIVAWEGEGTFSLHLPASVDRGRYALTLTPEDGEGPPRSLQGRLEDHAVEASDELDGRRFVARQLTLPGPLPHGYHRLQLRVEGSQGIGGEALVLSAPLRAYVPPDFDQARHWGVFLPLYALHSQRSAGAGDLGDLRELMTWVGERGGSVVGTLPLLAAFLDEPYEWSPYAPASRLAWNELYLHLEALPEYTASAKARTLYEGPQAQAERERLRQAPLVDYRAQMSLKRRVIAAMAESCFQTGSTRRAELEAFATERPEIDDYARFRAVTDAKRVIWPQWSEGLRSGTIGAADFDPADHRTHLYAQWAMHQQLTALRDHATGGATGGLGLYLDLPVGVNGCGYDTWRYGDLYVRELSTGAPPDTLFGGGQNWAFPPLHPERLREQGYGHLIDVVRNHLRYAGVLRIDHVMGLHRLYVIPQGASAKQGIYMRYRPEELYAIVAIESHRARCLVVGEDLGTVPDAVREAMERHRVHKIHVVQYVASERAEQALPKAPPDAVAGINTHDMPPFAAFWSGTDIDDRMELGWIDHEQARAEHAGRTRLRANIRRFLSRELTLAPDADASAALAACLQHLGRSETRLVLASLEDLWGELHPQNVPGTYLERPNWKRRAKLGLEEITTDPDVARMLSGLHRARKGLHDGVRPVRHDVTRLTDQDVYLFNEGTHERIYDKLGAHPMEVEGQEGTYFAVWAPGATYVSVVGDFNGWDRGLHPLRMHEGSGNRSGIWEGFVPGVAEGALYKLHIAGHDGWSEDKCDPVGFGTETPPLTASVVTRSRHAWKDAAWMEQRAGRNDLHAPISIYEVHLGSWRRVPEEGDRFLGYRELAPLLVEHCRTHGFTHVELMPVMEHPFFGSWGYQVTGYFAPSSRFGSPDDLRGLIDELHQAEIGVILDWVPSHFPADAHGLAYFDGTHLYEHADPRQGFHPDWNSAIFNYGRHEVRSFLISSALFWLDQFHADGLRVDGVASMLYLDYSRAAGEWVPNVYGGRENLDAIGFLRRLNEAVQASFPGVQTIAEESTAWPLVSRPTHLGGLGFGLKWDMGWMHDTLRYLAHDPIHRRWHQNELTFRLIYAFNESFVLSLSHDEVVHGKGSMLGKMPGDKWQKFANLRALYGYMWGQPGKKHLFMGQEFGQLAEWNHDRSLDWHLLHDPLHAGLQRWVGDLNHLYRELPSLHQWDCDPRGFEWIDFHDATFSVYSFMRRDEHGGLTVIVLNFTPVPRHDYRVGVPREGWWAERLNSDATTYGGSGVGNNGGVHADAHPAHERPFSVNLQLPPLGVLFLHQPAPVARGE